MTTTDTTDTRWGWIRARLNNIATRRLSGLSGVVTRWHARHADGPLGRLVSRIWLSAPVFTLTVVGRRSGLPRQVALMRVFAGDDLIVVGGTAGAPATPEWFVNLRAAGEAVAEVEGQRWPVVFREVTDPAEMADCKERFARVYPGMRVYEAHSDRVFPVGVLSPK